MSLRERTFLVACLQDQEALLVRGHLTSVLSHFVLLTLLMAVVVKQPAAAQALYSAELCQCSDSFDWPEGAPACHALC